MKITGIQATSLANKIHSELRKSIEKNFDNKLKNATIAFEKEYPNRFAQIRNFLDIEDQITALTIEQEKIRKAMKRWSGHWDNTIEKCVTTTYKLDDNCPSVQELKDEIILETIHLDDINQIVNIIKNKYLS